MDENTLEQTKVLNFEQLIEDSSLKPENSETDTHETIEQQLSKRVLEFSEIIIFSKKTPRDLLTDNIHNSYLNPQNPNLVINTLHLLSVLKRWDILPFDLLCTENSSIQLATAAHILRFCKEDVHNLDSVVDPLEDILKTKDLTQNSAKLIAELLSQVRYLLTMKLVREENIDPETQELFARTYKNADEKTIRHLIHDASINVQLATLQFLTQRKELPLSIVSSTLILLKNNNQATTNVLKLFKKHHAFPELILPALFDFMTTCNQADFALCLEVIEEFDDDAIPTVLSLFTSLHDKTSFILASIVQTAPKRFIPKICNLLTIPQQEHVHRNIISVLYNFSNDDEMARNAIENDKDLQSMSDITEQKTRKNEFKTPISVPTEEFHTRVLTQEELMPHIGSFDDVAILDLLNDGRVYTRVNAISVASLQKNKSPLIFERIQVWLKTSEPEIVDAAQAAMLNICDDDVFCTFTFLRHFCSAENEEMAKKSLSYLQQREQSINVLMDGFLDNPRRLEAPFAKLLKTSYAEILVPRLIQVIRVDARSSVNHYAMLALLGARIAPELLVPLREEFHKIFLSKSFYLDSINRRLALKCLRLLPSDPKTLDVLKSYVRNHPGSSLERPIKQILHVFKADLRDDDEEDFDSDDE